MAKRDLVADLEWWELARHQWRGVAPAARSMAKVTSAAGLDAGCAQLLADLVLVRRHVLVGEDQEFDNTLSVALRELVDERGIFAIVSIHGDFDVSEVFWHFPLVMFCKHPLQSASALTNQSSRSRARAEGGLPVGRAFIGS